MIIAFPKLNISYFMIKVNRTKRIKHYQQNISQIVGFLIIFIFQVFIYSFYIIY